MGEPLKNVDVHSAPEFFRAHMMGAHVRCLIHGQTKFCSCIRTAKAEDHCQHPVGFSINPPTLCDGSALLTNDQNFTDKNRRGFSA